MPRTFLTALENSGVRDQQRILFAAGLALVLHLSLLLFSPSSSGLKQWTQQAEQSISVYLKQQQTQRPAQQPAIEPTPMPVIASKTTPQVASDVQQNIEDTKTEQKTTVAISSSQASLQSWSKLETERLLRSDPSLLSEFSATFIAPKEAPVVAQRSFKSGYGDTHVISKIGNKQVCYMQSQEHPQDDWAKGLVMFYDCGTTEKFTLEIP